MRRLSSLAERSAKSAWFWLAVLAISGPVAHGAEYCSADPKRLKFVAVLPGSDVDEMVKEARRAVAELGAVSVL